jgi:hypothetical protein
MVFVFGFLRLTAALTRFPSSKVGKTTMVDKFIRNPIGQTDPTLDNRTDYRHAAPK